MQSQTPISKQTTILERGAETVAGRKHNGDSMPETAVRRRAPALTPEDREQQLISMAMDAAEKKFLEGRASDSLTIHFLRLATSKMELEKEKTRKEIAQLEAKTDAIQSMARMEELYQNAMAAMKTYGSSINQSTVEDA